MGSKARFVKHLLPVMLEARKPGQHWVEPFVGGANMIDKVEGPRIGNDINYYLIALLTKVRDGWKPPENLSKEKYMRIKAEPHRFKPELVGFAGILCSFGAKWFSSYASDSLNTNYAARGVRALLTQAPKLQSINFVFGDYKSMKLPSCSLIYCDPPYNKTPVKGFYGKEFDSFKFYNWCRSKANQGHTVFVSEYSAPKDFVLVKHTTTTSILNKKEETPRVENLYRVYSDKDNKKRAIAHRNATLNRLKLLSMLNTFKPIIR